MCGRISLFVPPSEIEGRFDATVAASFPPRYNVAPGEDLAVVRNDDPGRVRRAKWGLVPGWTDEDSGAGGGSGHVNARAETIAEKPSFSDAARERRGLVVVDGFYEWQERRGTSQPYRIEREDRAPFAMAGLWEPGDPRATATIVTTEPNAVVEPVHDRMPAILEPGEEKAWLAADDPAERESLLAPPSPEGFHAYPVSTAVNDPANDGPELLEAVEAPAEQTGLDEF